MADTNETALNLLTSHVKEEYSPTNIKVEDVNEEIVKTETEVSGASWVNQNVDIHELLANKNQNLENTEGQLLNENAGIRNGTIFEDNSNIWAKINDLSRNRQKDNKYGLDFDCASMDFDGEEKVSQHNLIENMKINNKKEDKLKFLHDDNDCLCAGTLKKRVLVPQKKCEKDVKHHLLVRIQPRHSVEKLYKCNECSYAAVRRRNLVHHIKSHHTMEEHYKCNECSYAAVRKRNIVHHIKSHHTMENHYKCNECSYTAVRKQELIRHIKSFHTMEKPYKCSECSYTAVRKCYLLCHIKSHQATEKPYKCNECSYATVRKQVLIRHIKSIHTMEKPYKCSECSYTAVRKSDLVCHIKSHQATEKSYKCNECSYSTALESSLLHHVKQRHTMEKPPNLQMLRMFL